MLTPDKRHINRHIPRAVLLDLARPRERTPLCRASCVISRTSTSARHRKVPEVLEGHLTACQPKRELLDQWNYDIAFGVGSPSNHRKIMGRRLRMAHSEWWFRMIRRTNGPSAARHVGTGNWWPATHCIG